MLTGRPGVGKTTCLKKALDRLRLPAGGFLTEEIREGGKRVGFALVTLDGQREILAHVSRRGQPRLGKYGVNPDALTRVGVPAIRDAARQGRLVVIDEIGKMEMTAPTFRDAVEEVLRGPAVVVGTILTVSHPWADRLKVSPAVRLFEVTPANRDAIVDRLAAILASPPGRDCPPPPS